MYYKIALAITIHHKAADTDTELQFWNTFELQDLKKVFAKSCQKFLEKISFGCQC